MPKRGPRTSNKPEVSASRWITTWLKGILEAGGLHKNHQVVFFMYDKSMVHNPYHPWDWYIYLDVPTLIP